MSDLARLDALKDRFDAQPMRGGAPYADALRRAGRVEEAIDVVSAALRRQPRNVFALVVLARCFRDQGEHEEASATIREALALDPADPTVRALESLSVVSAVPGSSRAAAPVPATDDADPNVPGAAVPTIFVTETMAELYLQQGLTAPAVAIYRELVARTPEDPRLAARLAELLAGPELTAEPLTAGLSDHSDISDVEIAWAVQAASEPESLSDDPVIGHVFDFPEEFERDAEAFPTQDDAMLAGLSFDAITLSTPVPPPARRPAPPPTDPVGDDFDQWLRGVS
jgi:tetratricopeptide (TPR) repeat protein